MTPHDFNGLVVPGGFTGYTHVDDADLAIAAS
jgi:hypothetical protein